MDDNFAEQVNKMLRDSEDAKHQEAAGKSKSEIINEAFEELPGETQSIPGAKIKCSPIKGVAAKCQPIRKTPTPGRNEQCPCGSGRKYKNCCMKGVVFNVDGQLFRIPFA